MVRTLLFALSALLVCPIFAHGNHGGNSGQRLYGLPFGKEPPTFGKRDWNAADGGGILFYGGDLDSRSGARSEQSNYWGFRTVYDNFVVTEPAWQVTAVFGNFVLNYTTDFATYSIRSGVSAGNGGTVIATGTHAATMQQTGGTLFGMNEYNVRVEIPALELLPGEYWVSINSATNGCGGGWLNSYIPTTSGAEGIGGPLGDGNAFLHGSGFNFVPAGNVFGSGNWDFSMGLEGTVIPEPVSGFAILTGLGALALRRRRNR